MGNEPIRTDKNQERIINFALLIQQKIDVNGINTTIRSENQGIADADIFLIVEAWLEKCKDNYKDAIKNSLSFGKPEDGK